MTINTTKIIAIISATVFFASAALFVGFFFVTIGLGEDVRIKQSERAQTEAHASELSTLVQLVETTTEERSTLQTYFLAEGDVIKFLELIESVGREQGATLITKSLTVTESNGDFSELHVVVSASGTYESLEHVLRIFESLPYQSYVNNITMSRSGSTDETDEWSGTFDVRITTYKTL
jgi:hypothetical protein